MYLSHLVHLLGDISDWFEVVIGNNLGGGTLRCRVADVPSLSAPVMGVVLVSSRWGRRCAGPPSPVGRGHEPPLFGLREGGGREGVGPERVDAALGPLPWFRWGLTVGTVLLADPAFTELYSRPAALKLGMDRELYLSLAR